ncbi:peroxisomal biogenesis factor 3 [Schistocerca piceifrons]|uniref:peroxisomal biogenesis factor 3 n=1 Tax=Schistocerca piceifrons TaxID=274613 RepID=UPI001F5E4B7D|nr:peroxisomal biogenesis factor 3 [Schistocerca piceifrons]
MSSVLSFLWRHKRKFLIGGAVIGSAVLATRYCVRSILNLQEAKARELIEQSKKRQHFENTERTCTETISSLISSFHDSVDRILDSQGIVNKLKTSPANKIELWEELKILVFARVCLIVYGAVILNIILRVQINVIGGYLYRSATNKLEFPLSGSLQEEYLSLCRNFLNNGMEELGNLIVQKVKDVVGPVNLDKNVDVEQIRRWLWTIQSAIEIERSDPVLCHLGSSLKTTQEAQVFQEMLNDTIDIISSSDVHTLSSNLVWEGFQYSIERIRESFEPVTQTSFGKKGFQQLFVTKPRVGIFKPMANALASINSVTLAPSSSDASNSFMHFLMSDEGLKIFGANVYEAFCEP